MKTTTDVSDSKFQQKLDCFDPKTLPGGSVIALPNAERRKDDFGCDGKTACVRRARANISGCGVQTLSTGPLRGYVYCTPALALAFVWQSAREGPAGVRLRRNTAAGVRHCGGR